MEFEKEWEVLLNAPYDLVSSKKRKEQFFTLYMNSTILTDAGKEEVGKITALGLQISEWIKKNNIDLITEINKNIDFSENQKEALINYSKDLDFLYPTGGTLGTFFDINKFPRFDKKTRETIKIWIAFLSVLGSGVLGSEKIYLNALKIQDEKINIQIIQNKEKMSDIELEKTIEELEFIKKKNILELEILENEIKERHTRMSNEENPNELKTK